LTVSMAKSPKSVTDPLLTGFYSVSDAARLIGGVSNRKINGWLDGWRKNPVLSRDFENSKTLSFLDLIEVRFVDFFRKQGVSMPTLERAAQRLRSEWSTEHPFALSNAKFVTDRRRIFAQIADEGGDKVTYDAASGQHEMWEAMEATINKGVVFDPASALAEKWTPRADYPTIVVDPKIAFGKPVVENTSVPTAAIFRLWRAEDSFTRVADAYKLSEQNIRNAVHFELAIAA
jgi:uncharacterized protein (DUF433 family)